MVFLHPGGRLTLQDCDGIGNLIIPMHISKFKLARYQLKGLALMGGSYKPPKYRRSISRQCRFGVRTNLFVVLLCKHRFPYRSSSPTIVPASELRWGLSGLLMMLINDDLHNELMDATFIELRKSGKWNKRPLPVCPARIAGV